MDLILKNNDSFLNSPAERLKNIREFLKLSRSYLGEKYGIPQITLKSWENGTVNLTVSALARCIQMYEKEGVLVTQEWILTGKGLPPKSLFNINQYFSTVCDNNADETLSEELSILEDLNFLKNKYKNSQILIVSNDEMAPFYNRGEYVFGIMIPKNRIDEAINKDCIVHLKGGDRLFRRLIKDAKGRYNLICLNPLPSTDEPVFFNVDIEQVAPVVLHRWKFCQN